MRFFRKVKDLQSLNNTFKVSVETASEPYVAPGGCI